VKLETLPQGVRLAVDAAKKKSRGHYRSRTQRCRSLHRLFRHLYGFQHPRRCKAICTEIEEQLYKNLGRSPEHREGRRSAEWALLDFGGFVVHVFGEQARRYYDLERLWRSAPKLDIPDDAETRSSDRKPSRMQLSARTRSTMKRFPAGTLGGRSQR